MIIYDDVRVGASARSREGQSILCEDGIEDAGDAFKLDDRSLLIAQAEYEIYPSLYFVGRFTRRWVLETEGSDAGIYVSNDDWVRA